MEWEAFLSLVMAEMFHCHFSEPSDVFSGFQSYLFQLHDKVMHKKEKKIYFFQELQLHFEVYLMTNIFVRKK